MDNIIGMVLEEEISEGVVIAYQSQNYRGKTNRGGYRGNPKFLVHPHYMYTPNT